MVDGGGYVTAAGPNDFTLNITTGPANRNSFTTSTGYTNAQTYNINFNLDSTIWPYAIYGLAASQITANINGTISGAPGNQVNFDTTGHLAGTGAITVSGTGAIATAGGTALLITTVDGPVTVTGLNGGLNGGIFGLRIANFTGATTVNIAGPITGVNSGIYVTSTTGNNSVTTGNVTSTANSAIVVDSTFGGATSGSNTITTNGTIQGALYGIFTQSTSGNNTVTANGSVTGTGNDGIYAFAQTTGANTVTTAGTVQGAGFGIRSASFTGNNTITTAGLVTGGNAGIYATSTTGNNSVTAGNVTSTANSAIVVDSAFGGATSGSNTITTTGTIQGALYGIFTQSTSGSNTVTASGPVRGTGNDGIYAFAQTTGANTITTSGTVQGAGFGIRSATFTGGQTIKTTGLVTGGNAGIYATSTDGNIAVSSANVTSTANSGIVTDSSGGTGSHTISTTGTIQGAIDGIFAKTASGNILVNGNGTSVAIGALEGIVANPTTSGNATVVNFASITGQRTGLYTVAGTGTTSIQGNGPITGNGLWGILSTATTGNINIGNITANNNIHGLLYGLEAITGGAGNINITHAAGYTIDGATYGLLTTTGTGLATVNNAGIIKTTSDSGLASQGLSQIALFQRAGNGITNNTGQIIGSIATAGTAYTLNNQAGGVWTPGLVNSFGAANDTVNNAGLIRVRSGDTAFNGLENFNNLSGGTINMQYGPAATDSLSVLNFSPKSGSNINVNVELSAANGPGDSGGQGRGDTILVFGTATPAGGTRINFASIGVPQTTLTGSVAIVNTTAADVPAPTPGQRVTASTNYVFGDQNLPLFGTKYKYTLEDDGGGGVFLVWQPNLTGDTLGAYTGAPLGSAGAAVAARGQFAGLGGFGGGPGSGVVGRVGDAAAGSFMGDRARERECGVSEGWNAWLQGDASRAHLRNQGGSGSYGAASLGIERDFSSLLGAPCGRYAVGIFGTAGGGSFGSQSGAIRNDLGAGGGFVRGTTDIGLYGAVVGSMGRSDNDLSNAVFGSTARSHATNSAVLGVAGHVLPLGSTTWLDNRVVGGWARSQGGAFTDTIGISVSSSQATLTGVTYTAGLHQAFSDTTIGFVRGGVRWLQVDNAVTAFGVKVTGKGDQTFGVAEAGFTSLLAPNLTFSGSGFGDFSKENVNVGVMARLNQQF